MKLRCPRCYGKGWVYDRPVGHHLTTENCIACHGTGYTDPGSGGGKAGKHMGAGEGNLTCESSNPAAGASKPKEADHAD